MDSLQLKEAKLKSIYFDSSHPASFAGIEPLFKAVKDEGISRREVVSFLETCNSYTLHKTARKKYRRRQIVVSNISDLYQMDLVDMRSLSKHNDNYTFLLTCIDCFSKKLWVVPLFRKTGIEVVRALKIIFQDAIPIRVEFDKGKEFLNNNVKKYLKDNGVKSFTTENDVHHAPIVERVNRSLKTRMYRMFTHLHTKRYIDQLEHLVSSYNKAWHSTIKMAPNDVKPTNVLQVYRNIYGINSSNKRVKRTKPRTILVGDYVRVSKVKLAFAKGYEANFSTEIFQVAFVGDTRDPTIFKLKDLEGTDINGVFYREELQKTVKPEKFNIDKIIKRRKRLGESEILVTWEGYPKSQATWIKSKDVESLVLPDSAQ